MNKKNFFSNFKSSFLLMIGVLSSTLNVQQVTAQLKPKEVITMIPRGINIGNSLDAPIYGNWDIRIEERHLTAIKEAGFQCVRIPVTWDLKFGTLSPYTINEPFFSEVEKVVNWALNKGLFVILNAHHEEWLKVDTSEDKKKRFDRLWEQIATRFRDKPDRLMFEMLNEPRTMSKDHLDNVNNRILKIIRKTNKTRIVLFSGTNFSNMDDLKEAIVPNDPYIMAYYHSYDPYKFGINGYGSFGSSEMNDIREKFAAAKAWSNSKKIPIILGEFGASSVPKFGGDGTTLADRQKYYRFVVQQALLNGIPFVVWDDPVKFDVFDRKTNTFPNGYKDILINTQARSVNSGSRESQNNSTAAEGSNLEVKSFLHNDILTVQLTGELSDVSLYSIDGKQLTTFSTKEVQKDIDMSKYTAGVYILKVSTAETNLTTKVIKK